MIWVGKPFLSLHVGAFDDPLKLIGLVTLPGYNRRRKKLAGSGMVGLIKRHRPSGGLCDTKPIDVCLHTFVELSQMR